MKVDIFTLQEITSSELSDFERNYERVFFTSTSLCDYKGITLIVKKGMLGLGEIKYMLEGDYDCISPDEYELYIFQDPEVETKKHIIIARNDYSDPEEEPNYIDIRYTVIDENEI